MNARNPASFKLVRALVWDTIAFQNIQLVGVGGADAEVGEGGGDDVLVLVSRGGVAREIFINTFDYSPGKEEEAD